jgi:hypothetical protein
MLSLTMNNLNLLSTIQDKNVNLNIRDNCLFIDNSWSSYLNWRINYDDVISNIQTTLLNTLIYLELNINRIGDLQSEYIEKLALFKKALESILILSKNSNYSKLIEIENNSRNTLRKLESLVEKHNSDTNSESDSESDSDSENNNQDKNSESNNYYNEYVIYIFNTISNGYTNIVNGLRNIFNIFF